MLGEVNIGVLEGYMGKTAARFSGSSLMGLHRRYYIVHGSKYHQNSAQKA